MDIRGITIKPEDTIFLRIEENDTLEDAEATYHTLLDYFPNNKVIVTFCGVEVEAYDGAGASN